MQQSAGKWAVGLIFCLVMGAGCLLLTGCPEKGLPSQVVHGAVTVGGENVELGRVRFVPIEGTSGPASMSPITDGQYRIEARGGVPIGKHRVEVDAKKKTGRQVEGHTGFEMGMIDETVRMGPDTYAGKDSPLVIEVTGKGDGRHDIEIPNE